MDQRTLRSLFANQGRMVIGTILFMCGWYLLATHPVIGILFTASGIYWLNYPAKKAANDISDLLWHYHWLLVDGYQEIYDHRQTIKDHPIYIQIRRHIDLVEILFRLLFRSTGLAAVLIIMSGAPLTIINICAVGILTWGAGNILIVTAIFDLFHKEVDLIRQLTRK